MSSTRRAANEINILAMLDRHEAGGLRKRILRGLRGRPAMFCYGAAGILVCGLVGTLAWLARDGGTPSPVDTALAGAVTSAGQPKATVQPPATAAPAAAAVRGGATIVDVAPAAQTPPRAMPAPPATAAHVPPPPHAVLREPPRLAAHPAAARPAPRLAAARPLAAGVHAARAETRGRRPAQPAKAAAAPVDTDVALISAIIQHANHRQESEEAAHKP